MASTARTCAALSQVPEWGGPVHLERLPQAVDPSLVAHDVAARRRVGGKAYGQNLPIDLANTRCNVGRLRRSAAFVGSAFSVPAAPSVLEAPSVLRALP